MLIIPAIDLKDGQCVRLKQGLMDDATVFSNSPGEQAAHWLEQDDVVYFHKIWCVLARRQAMAPDGPRDDRAVILDLAGRLGLTEAFPWPDWPGAPRPRTTPTRWPNA